MFRNDMIPRFIDLPYLELSQLLVTKVQFVSTSPTAEINICVRRRKEWRQQKELDVSFKGVNRFWRPVIASEYHWDINIIPRQQ